MKILLITSYDDLNELKKQNYDEITFDKCKSKFQIFALIIYKYFLRLDAEIILMNSSPNCKSVEFRFNINQLNIPQIDHTIIIEDNGFINRQTEFIKTIRNMTLGLVCGISMYAKCMSGEDIIFNVIPQNTIFPKFISLNYPIDDELFVSRKTNNKIEIMIGGNTTNCIDKCDITQMISLQVNEFINKNNLVEINMKTLTRDSIITYNNFTKKTTTSKNTTNFDYPMIYENTCIYFVTSKFEQPYFLYELSMMNILIVAPVGYVDDLTVKQLSIFTYSLQDLNNSKNIVLFVDEESKIILDELYDNYVGHDENNLMGTFIPWKLIFEKYQSHDIREKLISDKNTWKNAVDIIYQKLNSFKIQTPNVEIIPVLNSVDEINESSETEIKESSQKNIVNEKTKPINNSRQKYPVLLQSQLKNIK